MLGQLYCRSGLKRAEIDLLYLKIKLQKEQLGLIDLLYCLLYAWSTSWSSFKRVELDLPPQDQASEGATGPNWPSSVLFTLCSVNSRSSFERAEINLLYLKIKLQKGQLSQIYLLYCSLYAWSTSRSSIKNGRTWFTTSRSSFIRAAGPHWPSLVLFTICLVNFQSTELTRGPRVSSQGVHIGARALLVLNLIWFGWIAHLLQWEGGVGISLFKWFLPAFPHVEEGGVGVGTL